MATAIIRLETQRGQISFRVGVVSTLFHELVAVVVWTNSKVVMIKVLDESAESFSIIYLDIDLQHDNSC